MRVLALACFDEACFAVREFFVHNIVPTLRLLVEDLEDLDVAELDGRDELGSIDACRGEGGVDVLDGLDLLAADGGFNH